MEYRKHEIQKTRVTTDATKYCYGNRYNTIAYVYRIEGEHGKSEMQRPFLTSIQDCKNYIKDKMEIF